MVQIPVTVADRDSRPAAGLKQDNFLIFENGREQQITTVDNEDAFVSIGILLDLSGSMAPKLAAERYAVLQFIRWANPRDEFFLVGFDEQPKLIADFSSSEAELEAGLANAQPGHRTALLDAIDFGLEKMKAAQNQRKVLLVISDGGDNGSHRSEGKLLDEIRKSDVEIDSIAVVDKYALTLEERESTQVIEDLSRESGGLLIRVENPNQWGPAAETISKLLRHQYVIGYKPRDLTHDGKWRKVKVKVNSLPGMTPLSVYARSGYYAPSQ